MTDSNVPHRVSLLEEAWALGLQGLGGSGEGAATKRDAALRIAIALVEHDPFQLAAIALLVRLVAHAGKADAVTEAATQLSEAYLRRGDLPAATSAAFHAARAGADGKALRKAIAKAFGKGSPRLADVSPTPPPLPSTPADDPTLDAARGDALVERAIAALARFTQAEDPISAGKVPSLPLFSALEPAALERLLGAFEPRDLVFEELAIEQGDEGREAFVVVRGLLRAERASEGNEESVLLAALGPGAIFGEMALVSDAPRAASVVAQEPTTVLAASREALEAIAKNEPAIGRELGAFCRSRMLANLVRTSALLRAIPHGEREAVMALFGARTFQEGETLVTRGEESAGMFLLASGGVRVLAEDTAGGGDIVVADLGPGDVVGEISIVLRRPATATVVASFPTVALELTREQFQEAIRSHPAMLAELYQLATSREDELRSVVAQEALDVEEVVLV